MRFSRVLARFLVGYLALHVLTVGLFVIVISRATRTHMVQTARQEMHSLAIQFREHLRFSPDPVGDPDLDTYLRRLGEDTGFRYTLIDQNGTVVVDSATGREDIGPHGNRAEVVQAREEGLGFAERYSTTLDKSMLYLAIKYQFPLGSENQNPDEDLPAPEATSGFIRVSASADSINASIWQLQLSLWMFALVVSMLAALLMAALSWRMMRPLDSFSQTALNIGQGKLLDPVPHLNRDDEWGALAEAFSQMQRELRVRENQLLENNKRMQAVLSSMIEGVLGTSADGTVLTANRAACRMLSLSPKDLIGRNLLDLIRYPQLREAVDKARQTGSFSKSEFETLDRPRRIIKARVTVLPDQPNLGVSIVLHDVTELRALETMRRDFVANVSHELKTPLASIKAYAETLLLGAIGDSDKNVSFVQQIESQAELLNRQIQDLLELARVESGKRAVELQTVDVNQVCRECLGQLEAEAEHRGVELGSELESGEVRALADSVGVSTIIRNLISNAVHYTPRGGQVTVRTRQEETSVLIEVVDTGIGIAADQQGRIFERFYRVDKARSRDQGGTGLGLAIVKHLVQSFRGSIHLTSQVGKGSRFRIRLPQAGVTSAEGQVIDEDAS